MDYRHFQIRGQLSALMERAGQTATLRQYVSASSNAAEYGLQTGNAYVQRTITGIFEPLTVREVNTPGGQFQFGDTRVVTYLPLSKQDELTWQGQRWQVASDAATYTLWQTALFQSIITRS